MVSCTSGTLCGLVATLCAMSSVTSVVPALWSAGNHEYVTTCPALVPIVLVLLGHCICRCVRYISYVLSKGAIVNDILLVGVIFGALFEWTQIHIRQDNAERDRW